MGWVLWITVPAVSWLVWCVVSLCKNYQSARNMNLPIVVGAVSPLNIFWIILYRVFNISPILKHLSVPLGRWVTYSYIGWQFDSARKAHDELGPAFVLCTPGLNELFVADHNAAQSILMRRKDFTKPAMLYAPINVFGRNLDAAEGETWQRHRRLTAPNFNEQVSSQVWAEASKQAKEMLAQWASQGALGIDNLDEDTATLALHVLSSAGFGRYYTFKDAQQKPESPYRLTYLSSLRIVLQQFTLLTILPTGLMQFSLMPAAIRSVGMAAEDYRSYMKEMVTYEQGRSAANRTEGHNLLTSLIRASEQTSNDDGKVRGLAEDEIYGNIFIYNLAGHETTANVVAAAIAYLAAFPEWQQWIAEEIRGLPSNALYEQTFQKLERCLAVMFETLRLLGSVIHIPKTTGDHAQILTVGGQNILIPASTFVTVNSQALHLDEGIWGHDAKLWRPDRWILKERDAGTTNLWEPPDGSFLPWAEGPRICPGKKFSQVEFVAVMATLFRSHKVEPVLNMNETSPKARERVHNMIRDSAITGFTLQMRNPSAVRLAWLPVENRVETDQQ